MNNSNFIDFITNNDWPCPRRSIIITSYTKNGGAAYSAYSAPFSKITFPVIRKVCSTLIAQEIISTKSAPPSKGFITWLDFSHGDKK